MDLTLVALVKTATRQALRDLFACNERFYYLSLITTGEGLCPYLSAWSWEALEQYCAQNNIPAEEQGSIKWSYADSPYYSFGEEYFCAVAQYLLSRPSLHDLPLVSDRNSELDLRINSMVLAVQELLNDGDFSRFDRSDIVVNVEIIPPDSTNVERAQLLNPAAALVDWLLEAAENG